jgi:hypothetical protein
MTKNFIPRAKNAIKGDSILNHPQGKSQTKEQKNNENNT